MLGDYNILVLYEGAPGGGTVIQCHEESEPAVQSPKQYDFLEVFSLYPRVFKPVTSSSDFFGVSSIQYYHSISSVLAFLQPDVNMVPDTETENALWICRQNVVEVDVTTSHARATTLGRWLRRLSPMSLYVTRHKDQAYTTLQHTKRDILFDQVRELEEAGTQIDTRHSRVKLEVNTPKQGGSRQTLLSTLGHAEETVPSLVAEPADRKASVDGGITRYAAIRKRDARCAAVVEPTQLPEHQSLLLRPKVGDTTISIRGGGGTLGRVIVPWPRALPISIPSLPSQAGSLEKFHDCSVLKTNKAIEKLVRKSMSVPARSPTGWIYAFRGQRWTIPGDLQPIKIGHTASNINTRFAEISRTCRYAPVLLFAYAVPDPGRYEALVHATLRNYRWREVDGCLGCHKRHREWFVVDEEISRRAARLWACFAAQEPYGENGALKNEWKGWLGSEQMKSDDPWHWEKFVYGRFVDNFIIDSFRRRMSQRALAAPGILGAVTGVIAEREGLNMSDAQGRSVSRTSVSPSPS